MGEAAKDLLDRLKREDERAFRRNVEGRMVPNPTKRQPTPPPITGKRG